MIININQQMYRCTLSETYTENKYLYIFKKNCFYMIWCLRELQIIGIYQPMYWRINSRAGAVTLADLLALSVFETKNVKRIV